MLILALLVTTGDDLGPTLALKLPSAFPKPRSGGLTAHALWLRATELSRRTLAVGAGGPR